MTAGDALRSGIANPGAETIRYILREDSSIDTCEAQAVSSALMIAIGTKIGAIFVTVCVDRVPFLGTQMTPHLAASS